MRKTRTFLTAVLTAVSLTVLPLAGTANAQEADGDLPWTSVPATPDLMNDLITEVTEDLPWT
ncbi:hypothetical protein SUDANB21_05724 [Streptomyces sp. enrichment culture]|jgi:hypothetical protein|uniref:hypothetical protein n=1 Tax=Streptomyces sp. MD20-1-1 TaxID=3028668 RepID=UPI0029A2E648|nr:hypothetical protein [Streptomyces sp. MD20-1-1]WTC15589.1 hypothetical protein OH709_06650 [Streptomyces cellulosae]